MLGCLSLSSNTHQWTRHYGSFVSLPVPESYEFLLAKLHDLVGAYARAQASAMRVATEVCDDVAQGRPEQCRCQMTSLRDRGVPPLRVPDQLWSASYFGVRGQSPSASRSATRRGVDHEHEPSGSVQAV